MSHTTLNVIALQLSYKTPYVLRRCTTVECIKLIEKEKYRKLLDITEQLE